MQSNTQVQEWEFFDSTIGSAPSESPLDRTVDAAAIRSENNILGWMAYLPEDCIRRMIQMEWDLTT
jgi:hypothetical protein